MKRLRGGVRGEGEGGRGVVRRRLTEPSTTYGRGKGGGKELGRVRRGEDGLMDMRVFAIVG